MIKTKIIIYPENELKDETLLIMKFLKLENN
jgi:hypothetical protein